jgi:gliding motility-associated protein GldE
LETQLLPFLSVVFHPITAAIGAEMLVVVILLMCSALISGSEVAYFSLTPVEVDELEERNNRRSKLVLRHLERPEDLLANILITNNFVNIGIVILASFITSNLIEFGQSPVMGFIVQVVIITFMILLFGEIIPKIYADRFSVSFALLMALPLKVLSKIFRPLIYILTSTTTAVNRRMSRRRKNLSMDDLSDALDIATGVYSEEKRMLEGIVKFSNLEASEIMKPRTDVVDVDITAGFRELIEVIMESGYSRIPVYQETTDNVKGILYVKDLLPHLKKNDFRWQSLIRPPFFVPESKRINDLLQEFQKTKIHLAIVVDEYGGMEGIVTMEDILEEVVGEIVDESDEAEEFYRRLDHSTWLFDGKTLLNDFFKVTGIRDEVFDDVRGEAETLAGLLLELKGDFPKVNDLIDCKHIRFTVTDMDKRRIKEIKVKIMEELSDE